MKAWTGTLGCQDKESDGPPEGGDEKCPVGCAPLRTEPHAACRAETAVAEPHAACHHFRLHTHRAERVQAGPRHALYGGPEGWLRSAERKARSGLDT